MWRWILMIWVMAGGAALGQGPSPDEVRAVQYAFNRIERYPSGPVDGILGPLTRGAIARFAGARPVEDAFWPAAAHLADLVWWRAPWTQAVELAVRARLTQIAGRAHPPRIRTRRLWRGRTGWAACVELPTQEGLRWLHLSLRDTWHSPKPGAPPVRIFVAASPAPIPFEVSALWCRLGYVQEAR